MYIGISVFCGLWALCFVLVCWLAVEVARRMDAEAALDMAYRELDYAIHDNELARRAFEAGLREQFELECA